MIKTLGRNTENAKLADVIEVEGSKVYIRSYKQKDGFSNFKKLVSSVEITQDRLRLIDETFLTHGHGE